MAYNELLADRIRRILKDKNVQYREKKMFGGLSFLMDEKMCVGIIKEDLMARVDPDVYEEALTKKGCRKMDFTKRPLKGYVFINEEGTDFDDELEYWVQLCLDFNPNAKSSKKRKK